MARIGRTLFFAAFVAVVATAAWAQYEVQRSQEDDSSTSALSVAKLYDAVVQTENAAREYTWVPDQTTLAAYTASRAKVTDAVLTARTAVEGDRLRSQLHDELALIDRWAVMIERDVHTVTEASATSAAAATSAAVARGPQLAAIRKASNRLIFAIEQHGRRARDDAGTLGIGVVVALCAVFAALNWVLFVRTERRAALERDRQFAFAERMQTARSEEEARDMLARHLNEVAPDALATVTAAVDSSAPGWPIIAHGERIGTVLLDSDRVEPAVERLVQDSILRAAPVLGTLRTLAIAQTQAATDPLTGLGNRRFVEDALVRLIARSRRTGEAFAVAVIDVDQFKSVNDTLGHAAGDALLVAIAGALTTETRAYDIVGRHGGDEFVVLLSEVDPSEALGVMERCRAAIEMIGVGLPAFTTTASFGVATSEAGETDHPALLLRAADDAVYAAKARGGNCVVTRSVTGESAPISAVGA